MYACMYVCMHIYILHLQHAKTYNEQNGKYIINDNSPFKQFK